jgi:hypothetical protein
MKSKLTTRTKQGGAGWIKQSRNPDVDELMRFPFAFLLLTVIARRARRDNSQFNPHKLQLGEALLGDHESIGASEQNYRTAKDQLEEWGFATFRATNKGTIATLTDTRVYDINIIAQSNEQGNEHDNEPTASSDASPLTFPLTTNEEGKNLQEGKNEQEGKNAEEWKEEKNRSLSSSTTDEDNEPF